MSFKTSVTQCVRLATSGRIGGSRRAYLAKRRGRAIHAKLHKLEVANVVYNSNLSADVAMIVNWYTQLTHLLETGSVSEFALFDTRDNTVVNGVIDRIECMNSQIRLLEIKTHLTRCNNSGPSNSLRDYAKRQLLEYTIMFKRLISAPPQLPRRLGLYRLPPLVLNILPSALGVTTVYDLYRIYILPLFKQLDSYEILTPAVVFIDQTTYTRAIRQRQKTVPAIRVYVVE